MRVKSKDRIGQKFGRLTLVGLLKKQGHQGLHGHCLCECGATKDIAMRSLARGNTRSCGCLNDEVRREVDHGMARKPIYKAWTQMIQRCTNENGPRYKDYGGRGIKVCTEWLDFKRFYRDMGDRPEGHTIERVDNNLGYSKDNCKWATPREQNFNTRIRKDNRTGVSGVGFFKGRYRARFDNKHLGLFDDITSAALAVTQARIRVVI